MQAHHPVGHVPTASFYLSDGIPFPSSSSLIAGWTSIAATPRSSWHHHRTCNKRRLVVVSSSSRSSINEHRDYYSVLAIERNASPSDIKRAYRLLARQYHPDVSKHSQAAEMFKTIRRAYETLSNKAKRAQYDLELRIQENRPTGRVHRGYKYYSSQYEDEERNYSRAEAKRRTYWKHYKVEYNDEESSSDEDSDEMMAGEGSSDQERAPFVEVLKSAFLSLFLLRTLGAQVSVTFSSLMALFDPKLDAGYKTGHVVAWILGGRNGVLLSLSIQFTSWVCGKTSSSMVTLMVLAMWVASNLARYAPLPTGAVLVLLHMSMKLQVDLT